MRISCRLFSLNLNQCKFTDSLFTISFSENPLGIFSEKLLKFLVTVMETTDNFSGFSLIVKWIFTELNYGKSIIENQ